MNKLIITVLIAFATTAQANEKVTTNQYDADSDKREFRKQWGEKMVSRLSIA